MSIWTLSSTPLVGPGGGVREESKFKENTKITRNPSMRNHSVCLREQVSQIIEPSGHMAIFVCAMLIPVPLIVPLIFSNISKPPHYAKSQSTVCEGEGLNP